MYPHTGEGNQPRRTRRLRLAFDHRAAHHSLCVSPCCVVTYLSPALPPEPNSAPYGLRRGLCVLDLYCLKCDDLSLSWDSYFTVGAVPPPLGRRPRRRRFGARTPKYTAYLHEPL